MNYKQLFIRYLKENHLYDLFRTEYYFTHRQSSKFLTWKRNDYPTKFFSHSFSWSLTRGNYPNGSFAFWSQNNTSYLHFLANAIIYHSKVNLNNITLPIKLDDAEELFKKKYPLVSDDIELRIIIAQTLSRMIKKNENIC